MKIDGPATRNPADRMKVLGKATDRVDGPRKTTGTAPYAYERHDVAPNPAYGYVLGSAIGKGQIRGFDLDQARAAPGVLGIVTYENAGDLDLPSDDQPAANRSVDRLLAGPGVQHYHQAVAAVFATTFEQARHAAHLIKVDYLPEDGRYDLASLVDDTSLEEAHEPEEISRTGEFEAAFDQSAFRVDQRYTTSDESHCMMEPHATIAAWEGDHLTVWTSNQMIQWCVRDLSAILKIPPEKVRVDSPFIGGGFGAKLRVRSDVLLAALGAREIGRPVKIALPRPLIMNNTGRRAATRQRVRLGADDSGRLTAIAHDSWSGTLSGGRPEVATMQTRTNYAGPHRLLGLRKVVLDLVEGDSMRAPGEAPGHAAFEVALDELAEKLGMDPIELRILNDTQVDPRQPQIAFSQRPFVECLRRGADRFGWSQRNPRAAQTRRGRWLIGMGVAGAFRNNLLTPSKARVRLETDGQLTVETDMTDIGTGSYTILAQTAAEVMGLPLSKVEVRLGDSRFPESCGSGGQWGACNSTAGVYAACMKLRQTIATQLSFDAEDVDFEDGLVIAGDRSVPLAQVAQEAALVAEGGIEYDRAYRNSKAQCTFGAHFVELGVDAFTGEIRLRRMLAVCAAGRILNPKAARSQIIGAMVMGAGAALLEHAAVDARRGFLVNHDLAGYEVPAHADIPHQEVIFLDESDPYSSPIKAKGVGELGICGVGAAIANAVYHATGIRVRDYPITLEKLIDRLPEIT